MSSETYILVFRSRVFPNAGAFNSRLLRLNRDLMVRMISAFGWNPIELTLSCNTKQLSLLRNLVASHVCLKGGSMNLKRGWTVCLVGRRMISFQGIFSLRNLGWGWRASLIWDFAEFSHWFGTNWTRGDKLLKLLLAEFNNEIFNGWFDQLQISLPRGPLISGESGPLQSRHLMFLRKLIKIFH